MQNEKRLKIKNSFDGNLVYGAKDFNKATGRDIHVKNRENNNIVEVKGICSLVN